MLNNNCQVLYISYNGALEEIVPSQIIPYLRELAKQDYNFILLTFEKKQSLKEAGIEGVKNLKNGFKAMGIDWYWLRYHKRMSLLATSLDVLLGTIYASYLVVTRKIQIIHARSIVPAVMSLVPRLFGAKFVFDTRGLLAEEYVGGRHWKEGCLKYRIVKFFERLCLQLADATVVLTERHHEYLLSLPWVRNKGREMLIEVIPCCVDLDRFKYNSPEINLLREKENVENNFIFAYLGKIGKHYMLEEMLNFLKSVLAVLPNSKFMILTQSDQREISDIVASKRLDPGKLIVKRPSFEEIPYLISFVNAGIFFINPYKKFGSSPIKLGEFLSCGIPVIINSGIGDTEELVKANRVGVVVDRFDYNSYNDALRELLELIKEGEPLNKRCRRTAEEHLSLELGVKKYDTIYKKI